MNRNDYIFIFSLFETVVVMTCADKFLHYNNFFKQFTVWNMYTQLRYPYEWTTALNSFNIFIIFHMFFILEPELKTIIPQKCNLTINQFHVANIIMHIIVNVYYIFGVAPLVQCYLFNGGAVVFYVFLRVAGHRLNHRMSSLNAFRVEEPIEQVPLHKWCPLNIINIG